MRVFIRHVVLVWLLALFSQSAIAVPSIQNWATKNGARVFFLPAPEIPIVDVRVVFDAGSARDSVELAGLASLTNGLMIEGAGKLDANTISERMEDVGAQLGSGSLRDMAWLSVRALSDEKVLRETMGVLSLILSQPTFPADAFAREKKQMLVGYQASLQQPSALAERAFMKALYGKHPYAQPSGGNGKTIERIRQKDVRAFYNKYYVANNALIAIVGDLTRLKAEALAEVLSSGLRAGEKAPPLPEPQPIKQAKTIYIDFPSTQTHIWAGQPGMRRGDVDYFALYVGNHALGGSGLISVLSDEIREKRGYAYSAYSYFSPMRVNGPFQITLQTKNAHAKNALKLLHETVRDYLDAGISEKQLEASKQNITGGYALRLDSNKKLLNYIAMIGFYELPLDYINTFNANIESLTVKRVSDAMRKRVNVEKLITIVVGSKADENIAVKSNAR